MLMFFVNLLCMIKAEVRCKAVVAASRPTVNELMVKPVDSKD